jgi:hypothetical protein
LYYITEQGVAPQAAARLHHTLQEVDMSGIFLALALASLAWGVVSAIRIAAFLSARGHKISFLFFRLMILKYIHDYQVITSRENENGHAGPWFYAYITAMNLALVFAIVGMILR